MTNQIPDWVLDKLTDTNDKRLITTFFYLMKELGLSYDDLREMPVPAILLLSEELKSHNKKEERAYKKRR